MGNNFSILLPAGSMEHIFALEVEGFHSSEIIFDIEGHLHLLIILKADGPIISRRIHILTSSPP